RNVYRTLLLVSQDVRPHDERNLGQDSFLGNGYSFQFDLYSFVLPGCSRAASPHLQLPKLSGARRRLPAKSEDSCHDVYRGAPFVPDPVFVQFLLQYVQGTESGAQPMESEYSRV